MDIFPGKRKLVGPVAQAYEGKLCLPDFPRDFVWRRDEVADLLRSILRRYYIGSLLLLRCDPQRPPFAPVFMRGARSIYQEPRPEMLILDGQQRLTALIYALSAPNLTLKDSSQRRWFYVDLKLLLEDPYDDEIVFDRSERELDGLDRPEVQHQRRILPCTYLLRQEDFLAWRDGLDDWLQLANPEEHQRFRKEWRARWTNAITEFQTFEVPVVDLPPVEETNEESIGRVCAIFEKLNSTGVELSVYDLLTARIYPRGIKLHDLWEEACREHRRLAEWSEGKADTSKFGVLVLRTLALLRGLDPKPRILINLNPEGFENDWRQAAAAMERALELATHVSADGFGVFDRKWLPGFGLIPILAALRAEIENQKLGAEARSDLRRWYWSNVFLERYSSAVESKSRKDYVEFQNYWTEGKTEPSVFTETRARIDSGGYTIRDSASQASAIYRGVFCLLALRGARDWRRSESIQLQDLHDHHIFPQKYLHRHGLTKKVEVNSLVNRTLISDETNGKIRDKAPAEYIANPEIFPADPGQALLPPHFLTEAAIQAMQKATEQIATPEEMAFIYEEFRRAREEEIVLEIRKACGVG